MTGADPLSYMTGADPLSSPFGRIAVRQGSFTGLDDGLFYGMIGPFT